MPAPTVENELSQAAQKLESLYHQLPAVLTRLLLSGVAILLGILLLRLIKHVITKRIMRKTDLPTRALKQRETLRSLLTSVLSYLMYFFIALVVLGIFGIDLASILAVAGIGSIAIGFGAQTLVKDIISGMFLWIEGNVNVGDIVTIANQTGQVENITLRTTQLRGTDGSLYAVPNGDIRTVICRSHGAHVAQVNVTVAHGQDLLLAKEALENECALLQKDMNLEEAPVVYCSIANDARCVTMRVEAKCDSDESWELERVIRTRMFERLRKEEIKP